VNVNEYLCIGIQELEVNKPPIDQVRPYLPPQNSLRPS
jgi:hypothetical protein